MFEPISPFLAVGGILFYAVAVFFFLITVAFMSYHKTGKAFFTIVSFVAVITLFSNADPLGWLQANWLTALTYAGAYLAVGVVYMVVRWHFLSSYVARIYAEIRETLMKDRQITVVAAQKDKDDLRSNVRNDNRLYKLGVQVPLRVRDNKARTTTWLTFWPFSLFEYVLGDLLVNVVDWLVRTFSGTMQRISDRHFAKFSELN